MLPDPPWDWDVPHPERREERWRNTELTDLNQRKDSQHQRFTFSPARHSRAPQPLPKDGVSKDPPRTPPERSCFSPCSDSLGEQIVSPSLTASTLGPNVCPVYSPLPDYPWFLSECPENHGRALNASFNLFTPAARAWMCACECVWADDRLIATRSVMILEDISVELL